MRLVDPSKTCQSPSALRSRAFCVFQCFFGFIWFYWLGQHINDKECSSDEIGGSMKDRLQPRALLCSHRRATATNNRLPFHLFFISFYNFTILSLSPPIIMWLSSLRLTLFSSLVCLYITSFSHLKCLLWVAWNGFIYNAFHTK